MIKTHRVCEFEERNSRVISTRTRTGHETGDRREIPKKELERRKRVAKHRNQLCFLLPSPPKSNQKKIVWVGTEQLRKEGVCECGVEVLDRIKLGVARIGCPTGEIVAVLGQFLSYLEKPTFPLRNKMIGHMEMLIGRRSYSGR